MMESNLYIPYSYEQMDHLPQPKNEWERKIYRNIPYAKSGFIFKDAALQSFFEAHDWYEADSNYKDNYQELTDIEKEWLLSFQ